MKLRRVVLSLGCALLLALPAFSQGIPTGTLSGHLTTSGKQVLPGVTVTVTSPSLQGSRVATSNANGDYLVPLLPPGEYAVTFEVEGFQKATRAVKIAAAQTSPLDVDMALTGVTETIIVTGNAETISNNSTAQTTFPQQLINALPLNRTLQDTVLLNSGVNDNGPNGGITISGSQSYENLFLINGVVVNENVRGQPLDLYIEDAVDETTTSTSGISAEYGRFGGGVVNIITKSGGNEVHGTFRDSLSNDKWTAPTPVTTFRNDKVNNRYEGTLGGWFLKDRLWYFGAGRYRDLSNAAQTVLTNLPYTTDDKQTRLEGKLTISPFEGQRLIGSYTKVKQDLKNDSFGAIVDLASLINRSLPQDLLAANYTGVITSNLYGEAQYSRRRFTFVHSGSTFTDLINGTWIEDNNTGYLYNSPVFCGVCTNETRDNNDYTLKGSWFLSTGGFGSHDITAGADRFGDQVLSNNHQSGSDFSLFSSDTRYVNGQPFAVFRPGVSAFIVYWPIALSSKGTDFVTDSGYINDRWRLNDNFSFNLGVRYDKNAGHDSDGVKTARDSRFAPRLSASYDPKGDGDWLFNAGYGRYVTAIAGTQADSTSPAGVPAIFVWLYEGPNINTGSTLIPNGQVIQNVFNWFNGVGGVTGAPNLVQATIPGLSQVIRGSLNSPYTDEYTLGFVKRVGRSGLFRADYVHRKSYDFYSTAINGDTGVAHDAFGNAYDIGVLTNNNNDLSRKYDGLHTQFLYRPAERLNVGATYTLSYAKGNFGGETGGSGPVAAGVAQYPEYLQERWFAPVGYLGIDQRHRLRAWASYDVLKNSHNVLTVGLLQNYFSGLPYSAVGNVDSRPFVTNAPAYNQLPATQTYFYSSRGAFRTPDIFPTDLSATYSLDWNALGKNAEIFVEPQVLNVFNQKRAVGVNTTVFDATNDPTGTLVGFNPFTSTPVEGVNWRKGPNFGKPVTPGNYQAPRTFRFSVGLRF